MEIDSNPPEGAIPVIEEPEGSRALDLVFILDCTGSMGSYIASATKNIEEIVNSIITSGKLSTPTALRVGIVSYRDHPPQDNSYITETFAFTSDPLAVKVHLATRSASGGGDGPEAVTAGIKAATIMGWRRNSSKMAVIIADAPPHGIGEYGDGFPSGSPDGEDPLVLSRDMASRGISLFVVACEPALSGYVHGLDLFRALTKITGATLVPLTTANLLSHVIVGSALEQMDMERLIQEVGVAVAERLAGGLQTVDQVAIELHEKLLLRQEETKQLVVESIHKDSEEARHNVECFFQAPTLAEAKPHLKKIIGSRFTDAYLQSRYSSSSYSRSTTYGFTPSLPARAEPIATPASPPRKLVSEFKAFGSSGMSMSSTPLGSTGGEDEMDSLTQSIELRFGSISLDQAKRITQASAWRSAPPRG